LSLLDGFEPAQYFFHAGACYLLIAQQHFLFVAQLVFAVTQKLVFLLHFAAQADELIHFVFEGFQIAVTHAIACIVKERVCHYKTLKLQGQRQYSCSEF
jgi:hypothetical protein